MLSAKVIAILDGFLGFSRMLVQEKERKSEKNYQKPSINT
jgi:hypothetical protein